MLGVVLYVGRKSYYIIMITTSAFIIIGYVLNIPFFGVSTVILLITIIAGIITYNFFLKGDDN
jgi:hypothetical protein